MFANETKIKKPMEENEFKKRFPDIYNSIMNNRQKYVVYGMTIYLHSPLLAQAIVNHAEHERQFVYYHFLKAFLPCESIWTYGVIFKNCLN